MKLELLNQVVTGISGVRKDGASFVVAEDTDLSIYLGMPAEVLTVTRVSRITATAELLTIETHKGEKYFFATQDAAGVKVMQGEANRAGRSGTGFR